MYLVNQGRAGFLKLRNVHSNGFKGPARRAISSREAAPNILMRVNKHLNTIGMRFLDHRSDIIEVVLVIAARPGVFDGLPRYQKAEKGQAPFSQARKMLICLFQRERATNKRDISVVKKPFSEMGRSIGGERHFGTATEIDPAQDHCAALFVFEMRPIDMNHQVFLPTGSCAAFSVSEYNRAGKRRTRTMNNTKEGVLPVENSKEQREPEYPPGHLVACRLSRWPYTSGDSWTI